ncbi:MAG TPA: beta-N-acetylhexosaminidase [Candidatus Dormibacteraeota bacterium]|jgi:hexosaminidase|nr:beta-N-acetylhexosaminidase [Candidatus Dormibacteraeota bacterium]
MLIPRPLSLVRRPGTFALGPRTLVRGPDELVAALRRELAGAALPLSTAIANPEGRIELDLDPRMAAERYLLSIGPSAIRIVGGTRAGVLHGIQSLRQLLPPAIYRRAPVPGVRWEVPCVHVVDEPRFPWRGGMLDVGRHFMPKDFLFRFVDLLAIHKFNVFHLHLTEDQGWRFESRRYPRLMEVGAWRRETRGDATPHGGFYTQDDLREVVAYASEREIAIVPEIDMPGHTQAVVASYPEFGNDPEHPVGVATGWGVMEEVLNLEEPTLRFCEEILEEVMDVFPGPHVHIGGDECPTTQWAASERAARRMRELGIEDVARAQPWFTRRIAAFLAERGRRLVGWDEVVEEAPLPGATIMGWRSQEHGLNAARMGQEVVMTPLFRTYLTIGATPARTEPGGWRLALSLDEVYAYEPAPPELEAEARERVLGTQFGMWTEFIDTPRDLEVMAFPRACALAEVAWSPPERDLADFRRRLGSHLARLDALGVNYRPPDGLRPWQRVAPRDDAIGEEDSDQSR